MGLNSYQPLILYYAGKAVVQNANYTNATSYISVESTGTTLTGITYTSTTSEYGFKVEYGSYFNLYNSYVKDNSTSYSTVDGVCAYYMPGWINLVNDNINVTGYGLYLEYSPLFNVTGSLINATSYGIYSDNYANSGSTISGNTFLVPSGGEAMYLYADDVYNTYVGNNRILSSNISWGSYGIYIYADSVSSNITVVNNYVLNNNHPVYAYSYEYGYNVTVKNNTLVNSTDAIYIKDYSNAVVSGNTIINTTNGIFIYSDGLNVNVPNNVIENLPGYGGMNYGVYMEDSYSGNNIFSHNTVINVASNGEGIEVYDSANVIVFSNRIINGGEYGFYLEYNYPIVAFGNSITNADYGIYSYENYNFSYYSNTVTNSNYSFDSEYDYGGVAFANTFIDTQSNNSGLYFLYIDEPYGAVTLYHNNLINSTTNSTTANYFYIYYPIFMNQLLPVGGNHYSNYTGYGSNGIGSTPMNLSTNIQDMYPLLKKWTSPIVTFVETGLASGTSWSVKLGGNLQTVSSTSAVFQQTNGQYSTESYSVLNVPGYTTSVTSGSVSLDGSSNVVTVTFSPVTYSVTFTESGLTSGTSWSVTLNGQTKTSTTQDITFSVSNGSYSYTIGSVNGYTTTVSTGSVQVSGTSQTESVQFNAVTVTYTLTVSQTGLPSGDAWAVTVGNKTYNSTGDSISVQLVSGTYNVSVSGPSGYTVSLQSSNVAMNNRNGTLNVTFSASKGATGSSSSSLYVGIGIGAVAGAAVGLIGTMFYTGTGIFRKPEE